jgi:preprotein translocase subunit SecF
MARLDVEEVPYRDYSNRQLVAIPLAALVIALAIILGAFLLTGTPVSLGLDFTGGTELRMTADDASGSDIEAAFTDAGIEIDSVRSVGAGNSYILTTQETDTDALETVAEEVGDEVESVDSRAASFGDDTQRQALLGVIIAFVGMSVLVGLMFRTFVPSIAVVVSAFSDIVIPVALMNVLNIELSLGAVAALLMIIGYSVDSDILLNNHVLRRHGGFYESAYRAMRTGVSMTLTSIAAMATMFLVSWYLAIPLFDDIALILVFGLTADLMNTYMLNMSLLRWYKFEGVSA